MIDGMEVCSQTYPCQKSYIISIVLFHYYSLIVKL